MNQYINTLKIIFNISKNIIINIDIKYINIKRNKYNINHNINKPEK